MPDEGSLPSPAAMRRRRGFARHLLLFATVHALLVLAWVAVAVATGSWFPWPLVTMAVWGIGLQAHRRSAYAAVVPGSGRATGRGAARRGRPSPGGAPGGGRRGGR